jgi:hypothetical protein
MFFHEARHAAAILAAGTLLVGPVCRAADDDVRPVTTEKLPNVPGKSITAIVVNYAPGAKSDKHDHAGSVLAYVLSGEIRELRDRTGQGVQGRRKLLRAAGQRASRQRECQRDGARQPPRHLHRR